MVRFPAAGNLRSSDVLPGDKAIESEGGLIYEATTPMHDSQGIYSNLSRAAHAPDADHATAHSIAHIRICGESGRGFRAHRLDGSGPNAGEPRPAGGV